jgi:hypothetical protein
MPIQMLRHGQGLGTLPAEHVDIVSAVRIWAVMQRMGWCPMAAVSERIGRRAAAHLHMLMEEVGAAWPDPFCISPPCSPRLSHDEATFVQMMALARGADRSAFDRLLCELLPANERERLFLSCCALARARPF